MFNICVQGTVCQAEDGSDESTEGKVFLVGVVTLQSSFLYFGDDRLGEVETATLGLDCWEMFNEGLLDTDFEITHEPPGREIQSTSLQCFSEE